jgi:type II secretory pathway pseudopilin PulG
MKIIANQNGFTYILALTIMMIMGIMLGMVGQSWKTIKQRELEDEMIFRGDQVAELIYQRLLCKNAGLAQNTVNQFLWTINSPNGTILDDLVIGKEERCTNGTTKKFRLRPSAAMDPLTNKQWQIVKPVGDITRFSGVASDSGEEPFRKNFATIYDSKLLDEKGKYSDWSFTWELKQPVPKNQNQILNKN